MLHFFTPQSLPSFIIPPLIIVAILGSAFAFLAIPKPAKASVPIHCTGFLDLNCIKEMILDMIVRALVTSVVQTVINQVVAWITGNEGRNVGFVKNFEQQLFEQANIKGGEFFNHLAGINLCTLRIRGYLNYRLNIPRLNSRALGPQLRCTVTSIVGRIDRFYQDFSVGGWNAYLETNLIPQNNDMGIALIAERNFYDQQFMETDRFTTIMGAHQGFQGVTERLKSKRCEPPEPGLDPVCYTESAIKVPGTTIAHSLNKFLADAGIEYTFQADEISELLAAAISTIVNAALSKLMSGTLF